MKKLILFVLCALSGLMVSAQSRWGITPEGGFAADNLPTNTLYSHNINRISIQSIPVQTGKIHQRLP